MFKITKTYNEMSNEAYHQFGTEIISSSYLKNIYKHSIKKASIPLEQNEALIFGSQFHDMCEYGNELFVKKYGVIPEDCSNKRTKAYKEFIKNNPTAITKEDFSKLHNMYNSLQSNIFYSDLENKYKSYAEHSFFAEKDNLKFRIRPDKYYKYKNQIRYVIDFKTCQDVTKFMYDVKTYNYDLQAVFYSDVLQINPIDFYFIAIEKNYPYTTQVFGMSDTTIERGRTKMDIAIKRIKDNEKGVGMPLVQRI